MSVEAILLCSVAGGILLGFVILSIVQTCRIAARNVTIGKYVDWLGGAQAKKELALAAKNQAEIKLQGQVQEVTRLERIIRSERTERKEATRGTDKVIADLKRERDQFERIADAVAKAFTDEDYWKDDE